MKRCLTVLVFLFGVFGVAVADGQEALRESIPNWPAPPWFGPAATSARPRSLATLPVAPLPFIAINPCRIADTRGNGFTGQYGPPSLSGGPSRNFTLTGRCGIAVAAQAVSLNVTVTNAQGPGFILIYPLGAAQPVVSTLNYSAGQTVANAAVVALGTGGGVTVVAGVSGTDLILDVNGYYAATGAGAQNTFLGTNAGNFTMTGEANTGIGYGALFFNTTGIGNTAAGLGALLDNTSGNYNTALGEGALLDNFTGINNTASGASALQSNSTGHDNTAAGFQALLNNVGGSYNAAIGSEALENNTADQNTALGAGALQHNSSGSNNTASGEGALFSNTSGFENTANGEVALFFNTTGSDNPAIGTNALQQNTTGSENIGIGLDGGFNLTTGHRNICIGNSGAIGESDTIRIGTSFFQSATYIAGISGRDSPGGVTVFVNSDGKLGTTTSSRRFKEDIREIGQESDGLMRLRPVAFRYRTEIDPTKLTQYGLIAEEVAEVYPDLVVFDRDGRPETVRYHLLVPMLLNEVQKDRKTITELKARLERLETLMSESVR